mgnify:CR=1 FL=1
MNGCSVERRAQRTRDSYTHILDVLYVRPRTRPRTLFYYFITMNFLKITPLFYCFFRTSEAIIADCIYECWLLPDN